MNLARPSRLLSEWRWFPFALIGLLGAAVAVNIVMVYLALATFPGEAGQDGFDLSNAYGRVLEATARRAALGWRIDMQTDAGRHAVLRVTDRAGSPLPDSVVVARAERPLGPKQETTLSLVPRGPGELVSEQPFSRGRWTMFVTVSQGEETVSTTVQLAIP